MASDRIPVFLLSGFLGSGKTTLLNALLADPAFADTAVVVNEFGEIGLDHLLLAQGSDNVVLLESGCLCCTIAESLHETLADLWFRRVRGELPAFVRVIVETTGLADPGPILNTLLGHRLVTDHYRLEAVVVTVDAQHALQSLDRHPEVSRQIAVADRLVVTKRDLVPEPATLLARLERLAPLASVLDAREPATPRLAFAPAPLERVRVAAPRWRHATAPAGQHDAAIRADSFVLEQPPTWAGIAAWWRAVSERYGERVLRFKGLVRIADSGQVVFLQGVQKVFHSPQPLSGWPDADQRSRLVVISQGVGAEELARTLHLLDAPAGTPADAAAASVRRTEPQLQRDP